MRSIFLIVTLIVMSAIAEDLKVVCYLGRWAAYRPKLGKFDIPDIDPEICTHMVYSFVGLDEDKVKSLDPWMDLPEDNGKDGFRRFNRLKKKNPSLKTLLAIGGWNEPSDKYSAMAEDSEMRKNFVTSAISFVKRYGFNGFDVDWEYPNNRGGKPADIKNFGLLLKELREAIDENHLILSIAVAAPKRSASRSYNIPEISKHVHFINLMTYDFHGDWEAYTGVNAPLYYAPSDIDGSKDMNIHASVQYWISKGAPPEKLVLGVATYGRTFTLAYPEETNIWAPADGPGKSGPYTKQNGSLGYNEICEMQQKANWTVKFDEERKVPYSYLGDQWVSYDNIRSVKEKARYIIKMGLGGGMIWSMDTDDFRGKCGEKFPLIRALKHTLRQGSRELEPEPMTVLLFNMTAFH